MEDTHAYHNDDELEGLIGGGRGRRTSEHCHQMETD